MLSFTAPLTNKKLKLPGISSEKQRKKKQPFTIHNSIARPFDLKLLDSQPALTNYVLGEKQKSRTSGNVEVTNLKNEIEYLRKKLKTKEAHFSNVIVKKDALIKELRNEIDYLKELVLK